jgi:predicted transcriptional regulator
MVLCYECEDRRAVAATNRGLCEVCDPEIKVSEEAIIEAAKELEAEGLVRSVNVHRGESDE